METFSGNENRVPPFEEIERQYREPLRIFFAREGFSPEDTEDLLQETFTHIWQTMDAYVNDAQFRSWIYSVAANRSIDFVRWRKAARRGGGRTARSLSALPENGYCAIADPKGRPADQQCISRENIERIPAVMQRHMPHADVQYGLRALQMRADGYSYREISAAMHAPEVNLRMTICRARRLLRSTIGA